MNRILEDIATEFQLIIRNEYHSQIKLANGKYHDFWVMKNGNSLKVKLAGMQKVQFYHNSGGLLHRLRAFDYDKSDHTTMLELERLLVKIKKHNKPGIYCDAGYKDGHAKIAVVRKDKNDLDIHVREITALSNIEAECEAIKYAAFKFPIFGLLIYSDCKPAIDTMKIAYPQLRWLGREHQEMKSVDKLANLRHA